MSRLTGKERSKIPSGEFGIPSQRKYPMEDASHARNAKARASEMEHKGRISKGTEAKIDRKADKVLGHSSVRNPESHPAKCEEC